MAAATTAARDAGVVAQALARSAWNERLGIGAVLALGHGLVEGPAKAILATIAAVLMGKPYASLRDKDAGDLIKKLHSKGVGQWIEGLDEAVRNAHAHHDWRLTDGQVELRPGKPGSRTLAVDELVDLVLSGVESLLALDAAVILATGSAGIDFSGIDWQAALSLDEENAIRLMLAAAGWVDIDVTVHDGEVRVAATAPTTAFSIGTIGALGGVLRPTTDTLHISVELSDGRRRTLEGPASLLRAMQTAEGEDEKGIAMAELLHGFRLDGQPIASRTFVRRWSTTFIIRALQSPLPEAIRVLRPVRELAHRLGDEEQEQLVTDSMRLCRQVRTGDIVNPVETQTFEKARVWANLDVNLLEF
jgi:hypothetical protein